MKNLIIAIALIASNIVITPSIFAQDKKDITTTTIHVDGVCGACKKRIENAAYINGVKSAEWNKTTNELTITFKPSKTTIEAISENIAKHGHDAGEAKATEKAYNSLPACCSYKNDNATKH